MSACGSSVDCDLQPGDCLLRGLEHEIERRLKACPQAQLAAMLRRLESRLGTTQERPRDFEHARIVAHQLNNRLAVERMRADLKKAQEKIN